MTAAPDRYRFRLRFGKTGSMRWTGHLDLQKNVERMVRRAKLPMWHSKGFHPRPKLVFASALPLGQTSDVELMDLWLEERFEEGVLLERVRRFTHPDLPVHEVALRPEREPSLAVLLESARYHVTLLEPVEPTTLRGRVDALLASEALPRERRGKSYDLRPLIEALTVDDEGALSMQLSAREGRNGRAEEVLLALELDPAECRIERTALILREVETKTAAEPEPVPAPDAAPE